MAKPGHIASEGATPRKRRQGALSKVLQNKEGRHACSCFVKEAGHSPACWGLAFVGLQPPVTPNSWQELSRAGTPPDFGCWNPDHSLRPLWVPQGLSQL